MPSQRRMKLFSLLFLLVIIVTFYMTGAARQTRNSDFYTKTQQELQAREYEKATKSRDMDDMNARLKAAEESAKQLANERNQKFHDSVDGGDGSDKSVAGRVMLKEQGSDKKQVPGVANVGGRTGNIGTSKKESKTQEEHEVEVELNAILKKSPIIIFSKSYCPHSADAKRILLDTYKIAPAPYVVELDQHPMGQRLQATLGETTGRRTVPNVLVIGKSIGGGDDMIELHRSNKLIETLQRMGGSRIVEVERRGASSEMRRRRA